MLLGTAQTRKCFIIVSRAENNVTGNSADKETFYCCFTNRKQCYWEHRRQENVLLLFHKQKTMLLGTAQTRKRYIVVLQAENNVSGKSADKETFYCYFMSRKPCYW